MCGVQRHGRSTSITNIVAEKRRVSANAPAKIQAAPDVCLWSAGLGIRAWRQKCRPVDYWHAFDHDRLSATKLKDVGKALCRR